MENEKRGKMIYVCPMHLEEHSEKPGRCQKCGMELVPQKGAEGHTKKSHESHMAHIKNPKVSSWEKFKMSMTMTMGMDHTGMAGREMAKTMEEDIRFKFLFALVLTIPIVAYSPIGANILGLHLPAPIPIHWILFLLVTPVYFYSGWIFLYSSAKALQQRTLNMSVLIAVGITAAYGFSVLLSILGSHDSFYDAAAMLITFVLFGHWMEMKSRRGTTDALQALFDLVPSQARVLRNGVEELIPTSNVKVGDMLILKPGDKVPVDGEVVEGETSIDESLVTGESMPVSKVANDVIIGGSINQFGSVKYRATKVGEDTALSQIVKMVETAQNSKAPGQRVADKFAQYLVVFAIGAGLLTFGAWYLLAGSGFILALTFAISAVVIACPDALGLATPTAVAVGTGIGAKHNILIKDAQTLEQISKIQVVVFDKTGTLTEGKPKVTDFLFMKEIAEVQEQLKWQLPKRLDLKKYILALAASIEAESEHTLSKAIVEFAKTEQTANYPVEKFQAMGGWGIIGSVDGRRVVIGTRKLMENQKVMRCTELDESAERLVAEAKSVAFVGVDGKNIALFAVADTIRETAKKTIDKLSELGIETVMITGDNKITANAIAGKLGIKRVFAEVMPQDKEKYVKELQKEGKFVAMVGDGINDAPALAQADVGVAIGAGTDVAIETAKVVLMKSDPVDVLRAIRLSKATIRKMKENLFWASIYNLLAVPIAAGILYPSFGISLPPEIAALFMSVSSIIVATNAVLLKGVEKNLVNV